MNTSLIGPAFAGALLLSSFPGLAQTIALTPTTPVLSPVRIEIVKSFQWQHEVEKKSAESSSDGKYRHHTAQASTVVPKVSAVRYDLRVSNNGVKALGSVQIQWSVLLHGNIVRDGHATGEIGIGGAWSGRTSTFPIGNPSDVDGCVVEVVAGGQTIATEEEPPGIKIRVDARRKSETQPPRKKKKAAE